LRSIAEERSAFNVFVLPGDSPEYLDELLRRAGFLVNYRLTQMVCEESGELQSEPLEPATGPTRELVARFMAEQFFPRQSAEFREAVAKATAFANGVELFFARRRGRMVGAVLISESQGVLGAYNLCVADGRRGRGIGSSIVNWVAAEAARRGIPVSLQCAPKIEAWYSGLGFKQVGVVDVYHLSNAQPSDIMELG
jgi:GNAT superfamily N-acetyltransferase